MRKVLLTGILLVASVASFAQTILSGSEVFGKDRKEGFYMTLNIEKKFIEKEWSLFISKYGGVAQSRETFNIAAANISEVSPDPINLMSKIISDQKVKTKVFASFDLGGGNMVSDNNKEFKGVEKILKDFYAFAMQNEDVRLAERDAEESQKNLDRVNKTGDRIARDIEKNKREKEKLLKEIEENRVELEKLLKDQTSNKQDQENARIALEEKQKAASVVKTRIK
ncbi:MULTISPECIES: hypothetical protein [Emticicia]|uniref:hypothetical protein n=1 Tax=Emticicia TaxID=312278 RepID=UPI0007D89815|nr:MULTISPECIES: hypothetical protein [Emticicia]